MIQTVEAVIESGGRVRLLGPVAVDAPRRAIVTVLDEPAEATGEPPLLAEAALSDWNRPEEDAAWAHLQPAKSCCCRFRSPTCRIGVLSPQAFGRVLAAVIALFPAP